MHAHTSSGGKVKDTLLESILGTVCNCPFCQPSRSEVGLTLLISLYSFQVLLELAKVLFEEQSTLSNIVRRIMELTISLLRCERCSILLVDETSKVS